MGGLGVSFLARRARASWLLLACVVVTVLLATGLAAVLWTFAARVVPVGALSALAAPQNRSVALHGVLEDAGEGAADSREIRATLGKAWPGVPFQLERALWSAPLQVSFTAANPSSPGSLNGLGGVTGTSTSTQIQPASLDGFRAQATLTAGKWPAAPRRGQPVPVALPAAAASRLHLALGSVVTGTRQSGGPPVSLQVTGFFRPRDPASPYWGLDLLPSSGTSVKNGAFATPSGNAPFVTVSYGPAVVNPAAFDGALSPGQGSWLVLPQARAMANSSLGALTASTNQAVSQLIELRPEGLQITSRLPRVLAGVASTVVLTRSLFTIAALQLLLVAGAALVLAARLLASLREEESALLRARGASRWHVTRPVLAEAVVLGAVASVAGVLAGTRLTNVLASLGNLRLVGYESRGVTLLAWWSALAMLLVCAAVMVWPALRSLTPDAARVRRGRQARLAVIAWAGGDLALVALAAIAIWQLRGYSAVAHPVTGALGIDPAVAVAPALAVAGVALIPLRGLPLLARLADKTTDRGRRLAAAMVSWQIARRPIRQTGPALLIVVATATTTLALAGYASWQRSAADQATFAVGADVRVDAAAALPMAAAGSVAGAPGVTAATAASVAGIGNGGQLIALDPRTAGKTILLRPDLSPLPPGALWQRITARQPSGLALPGRPARLELRAVLGAGPGSTTATLLRAVGAGTVTAWVQDASGGVYQVPADGPLAADGHPHSLVFPLAGSRQASLPLRLLGLTLTYVLPPYEPASPRSSPAASLGIESLAAASAGGPFGVPFARGAALATWRDIASSATVPTGPVGPYGGPPPADGAPPAALSRGAAPGGGQRLTFTTGHDPSAQVQSEVNFNPAGATAQVALTVQPPSQLTIPAIATGGYLSASRLKVGSQTSVSLNGYPVTVDVVASVARFPAVFGQNRALIVDLAELNDLLVASQGVPVPVNRWWLRTAGSQPPRLPAGLGLSVTDRAGQRAALLGNSLLGAPRQAMLAIGIAAVLLGVLGFSVSVAASLRARRTQSAVFAALGVGKNAQAGQLCLEQCAVSIPAAAAGLLTGIGLAQLLVPAITLTADAAAPVPPPLVTVPLGPAVALALVTAALPAAAAALSMLRRPDPAARLRAEAA
jgi:hypothetical protein